MPEVLRRKVRRAVEHGVTLAPSETKALMTATALGPTRSAKPADAMLRGEAKSPRRPKFIGPIALRHGPRKNCKISETRARSA